MRGIPPRTMGDVARGRAVPGTRLEKGKVPAAATPVSRRGRAVPSTRLAKSMVPAAVGPGRRSGRPDSALGAERSKLARVRSPLVDVFDEAEEVIVVVDLGGFTRGEISLTMSPRQYTIRARRGDHTFEEVIRLPRGVDPDRARERLVHGVLEIAVPRRTSRSRPPEQRRNGRRAE